MFEKLSKVKLEWNPATRAGICMSPMLIAYVLGFSDLVVPLGQGGFFYSIIPLPKKHLEKMAYLFVLLSVGMGFYLLGGNVVFNIWISLIITFVVAIVVALLSGLKVMAPLAFTLITIYSAGLNVSNPDKLNSNFLGFAFIFAICGLVSLLPFWKTTDLSKVHIFEQAKNLKTGIRLGIGAVIALFVANLFGFAKLGWPVSAVGSIVRMDEEESKKRAISRVIGTVGGGILVIIIFFFVKDPLYLILLGFIFGILHSLFSNTMIGKTVFFYTVTILILYSLADISLGPTVAIQRIVYNMVGVFIALFAIFYSFPVIMRRIDSKIEDYYNSQ